METTNGTVEAPVFFATPAEMRAWLEQYHAQERELHVGYYRKGLNRRNITWPESVDEALCFGWIDGVRRSLGTDSYSNRFTPRRPVSTWSAVNIARVAVLTAEGRMQPAGLRAFEARQEGRSRIYTYEQPGRRERLAAQPVEFEEPYAGQLRQNAAAWAYFQQQAPSCRKKWINWVLTAKAEETRRRRLEKLAAMCDAGKRL